MAENIDAILWISVPAGPGRWKYLYLSPGYARIFGRPVEAVYDDAIAWTNAIHPDDKGRITGILRSLADQGRGDLAVPDYRIIRPDGAIRWIRTRVNTIRGPDGAPCVIAGIADDITAYKQTEEALRVSEEMFRALAETMPSAVCLFRDEEFIYVNPAVERISGYRKEDFARFKLWDLVPPEFHDSLIVQHRQRKDGKSVPLQFEMQFVNCSGEKRWIDVSVGSVNIGGSLAYIATANDITGQKQAESWLQLTRLSIERAADEVFWIAQDGRIAYVNETTCALLKYSREDLQGMYIWDIDAECTPEDWPRFWQGLREETSRTIITRHRTSDGQIIPVEVSINYVKLGHREIHFSYARDISERVRAEEELKAAKALAELYLDLMGHDINNMHQAALGYMEMARDMQTDPVMREILEKPIEVLQRSALLIKNVRKLQKLKERTFQSVPVDLCKVLEDVRQEYGKMPRKTVTLELSGIAGARVMANELLYDVFSNLVGNAIKHAGEAAVVLIRLDRIDDRGRPYYRVSVEDDGPGISDDFKMLVFNRMLKGTSSSKGIGLGLYLVRSLADSYDGRVWVEDRVPGDHTKGAKFVVVIPAFDA